MTSNFDFNLRFASKNQNFDIGFKQSVPSKDSVRIDGRTYSLVGDDFKILWLKTKLPDLNGSGMTSTGLINKLVQLGAKDISTSAKVNTVGIETLNLGAAEEVAELQLEATENKTENVLPVHIMKYLERVKTHPAFSGVITVQWGNAKPMTIVTENSKASSDTQFNIMSAGKAITATAIMQLVEQGKLSLTTPLSAIGLTESDFHLSESDPKYRQDLCPNPEFSQDVEEAISKFSQDKTVTIGDLLKHEAGLKDDMHHAGLRFKPEQIGNQKAYSNYGYQILARVIEKISGEPFVTYVQKQIFDKCEASGSAKPSVQEPTPQVCLMGQLTKAPGTPEETRVPNADGNGCWWMKAGDLLKFAKAFSGGQLLSREQSKRVLTGSLTEPSKK